MSVDLEQHLDRAYPTTAIEVPDPARIWQRGRTARRGRRTIRAVAAATAMAAAAVLLGLVVVPGTGSEGSGPYIAGTTTVNLSDVATVELAELPTLRPPDGRLVVAALDAAIAFTQADTTAWVPTSLAVPGDPPYRIAGRGQRLVFYGGDAIYAMDGDVDAQPEPIASGQDGVVFVPSDHPRRIWVQHGPGDSSARQVQEVSVEGTVTVAPIRAPAGNLVAALGTGVVLQHQGQLTVWDPHQQTVIAETAGPFAMGTSGDTLAWCDQDCTAIKITHVNSGATRTAIEFDGDGSFVGDSGRLSPDGRWLAAIVCRTPDVCGIVLADLHTGRVQTHGLGTVPTDGDLEWSPRSDRLTVELADDHGGILHPGQQLRRTHHPLSQELHPDVHGIAMVTGRLTW